MANIIALLACVEAHEGPWLRPCGREAGVRVYPELGEGEEVIIDLELDGDALGEHVTSRKVFSGFTPLALAGAVRYRARKTGHGTPTSVEIVTNGKAQPPSPAHDPGGGN